ncbi:MAG TPA: hypothetical protein VNF47_04050 [Streptosporangiaceae bacterium]|nr:hypothetical protein [Streptosporangiaceae bacterium]
MTLRYNWADVTERPCGVAAEIAVVLQQHGWTARPRRCGPGCRLAQPMITDDSPRIAQGIVRDHE